jgi:hypothetical protein
MKTSLFQTLLVLLAIVVFAGCQQDDVVKKSSDRPSYMSIEEFDQFNAKQALQPEEAENLITSRAPISYVGQLWNGNTNGTHTTQGDESPGTPPNATNDFYSYYAFVGNVINIDLRRITCEMDPTFSTYAGVYPDNTLFGSIIDFADDEIAPACNTPCGPFGDARFNHAITTQGWYTIAVSDFLSCAGPNYDYQLQVSGLQRYLVQQGCYSPVLVTDAAVVAAMQAALDNCYNNSATSAAYVACVTTLTNTWVSQSKITRAQKSKIITCAQGVPF